MAQKSRNLEAIVYYIWESFEAEMAICVAFDILVKSTANRTVEG